MLYALLTQLCLALLLSSARSVDVRSGVLPQGPVGIGQHQAIVAKLSGLVEKIWPWQSAGQTKEDAKKTMEGEQQQQKRGAETQHQSKGSSALLQQKGEARTQNSQAVEILADGRVATISSDSLHVADGSRSTQVMRRETNPTNAEETPSFDTYVINLDVRPDRCRCMAQQLGSAPQNVYRQTAVSGASCDLGRDTSTLWGNRNHTAEISLFCSNYKVWERALHSDADFVIIMEDDAILGERFWPQVSNFVETCKAFDYVAVDSWTNRNPSDQEHANVCAYAGHSKLFRPLPHRLDYWGTHVQIIRKSFLQVLIQKAQKFGMGPMDLWWMTHANEGKSFSWQPKVSSQADAADSNSLLRICSDSVKHSDIAPPAGLVEGGELGTPARLKCN
eukprot:TRINITY_DN111704_c0_g1_i1.p1 TRINITY_DN111704_c0_g1~~TRINITY_DN111704_c0_g1_i1.p1  ORF type:complete len:391 (-),score=55.12 TRINITY_DN111704_c0_g1_i1:120-1292(-)